MTPGKVTAMASQSPDGRVKEISLSFSLRGAILGLSIPTAGALMISKESREIFLRPSGESGSIRNVRVCGPSVRFVNSPIKALFSVAPEV